MVVLFYLTSRGQGTGPDIKVESAPINRNAKLGASFAPVVKKAAPGVVNIYSTTTVHMRPRHWNPFFNDPLFRQFFGDQSGPGNSPEITRHETSLGSGVIVSPDGYILTANHVVEGADKIRVNVAGDEKKYTATIIGTDPSTDVAVLKIDAKNLPAITLGNSDQLEVGDVALAIGNPFGVGQTVTMGIVSGLGRHFNDRLGGDSLQHYQDFIQTDAAINPGNSGGPLLDTHGRLIGMNTAIATKTGQNAGVGFAIPASLITRVVPELIATGHVVRPETGISRVYETEKGLLVATLVPGGPAAQAGMHGFKVVTQLKHQGPFTYETQTIDRSAADLIIAVNGQPTLTADDFLSAIDAFHPGDEVTIAVRREGHDVPLRVRLSAGES
jgi:serine protease Do